MSRFFVVGLGWDSGFRRVTNQQGGPSTNLFKTKDFSLQKLGIGGLDAEFVDIFRRAFASCVFPPHVVSK